MEQVYREKSGCSGCGACAYACPAGAIAMKADEEGFLYPVIRQELCLDCGACARICPFQAKGHGKHEEEPDCYVAKHRQAAALAASTSGGAFTALSDAALSQGGAVYGVVFDKMLRAVHRRAETGEERDSMRFSKYVQSDLGRTFAQVKADLLEDRPVLFTGCPCQNAGLQAYLGPLARARQLICCDVICYGVPSPRAWEEYKALLEQERGGTLQYVSFRSKALGWSRQNSNELFQYRTSVMEANGWDDRFYRLFFQNRAVIRPSCGQCPYTDSRRCTDLTIADYWGVERYAPRLYDSRGVSLVLASTSKGKRLLAAAAPQLWLEERPLEEALAQQGKLGEPVKLPENRREFWRILDEMGMANAMKWALEERERR